MGKSENKIIKEEVLKIMNDAEIILFGSRAKNDYDTKSDYDVLIKVNGNLNIKEKISLSTKISKALAEKNIPADIIVQDSDDITKKSSIPGNIVREAILNGITL